jgi:protein tyrosine/serine phosphatase
MLKRLADRFEAWQERLSQTHGTDISTPKARRAARWHLTLHDHSFLRRYWTNLHEIGPGIWRANQPSPERLRQWHGDLGLKSVLNLRGKHRLSHWLFEEEVCRETGMELVDHQMNAWNPPSKAEIEAVIGTLTALPRPVLFHCKSGADRTGIVAALYLALVENRPYDEVRAQVSFKFIHRDAGRTGVLDHIFRVYERDFAAKGISFGDWMRGPDYDPDAIMASYTVWNAKGRKGDF